MSWVLLALTAVLWGATNPFIKKGSGIKSVKQNSRVKQVFYEIWFLIKRWQFTIPFLLNQSGSVLFVYALQSVDLTIAVPLTNSLTFLINGIVSQGLGEEKITKRGALGMLCILSGTSICAISKAV